MKLKTLRLENFQGIRRAEFEFGGHSASIYGDNGTGKTTLYNAFTWLLFDKASTGEKGFTPKTTGGDGDGLHHLSHSAEVVCVMGDGSLVSFRKTFREVYKKKRGSSAESFDGHTVDYAINGVPTREAEFNAAVRTYCGGAEKMKILTMPDYFPEAMSWQDRRAVLLELCGEIPDAAIIESSGELRGLWNFLRVPGADGQHYEVGEYRKIAEAQKREINRELQGIPERIDEAKRAIPADVDDVSYIPMALEQLRREREELETKLADAVAGNTALAEARQRTAEAEAALAEARQSFLVQSGNSSEAALDRIGELAGQQIRLRADADKLLESSARKLREADRLEVQRGELRRQWVEARAMQFDVAAEVCPTCGQRLPPDRISAMAEEFNLRKSRRLEEITAKGKSECSGEIIAAMRKEAGAESEEAVKLDGQAKELQTQIDGLRSQITSAPVFEATAEYKTHATRISVCKAAEAKAGKDTSAAVEAVSGELRANDEEAAKLRKLQAQSEQAQGQRQRIKELECREAELGAAFEQLEHGLYLCDQFTREKVRLLTENINDRFHAVRFRLFQEQVSGTLKEDCEALVPGNNGQLVPYSTANNAARVNAGLEIINVLGRHWGLEMPVFVDNAESVTHLAVAGTQTIRLVVSEQDKQLRLEIDKANL